MCTRTSGVFMAQIRRPRLCISSTTTTWSQSHPPAAWTSKPSCSRTNANFSMRSINCVNKRRYLMRNQFCGLRWTTLDSRKWTSQRWSTSTRSHRVKSWCCLWRHRPKTDPSSSTCWTWSTSRLRSSWNRSSSLRNNTSPPWSASGKQFLTSTITWNTTLTPSS